MRYLLSTLVFISAFSAPVLANDYFNNILSIIEPPHSHTSIIATNLISGETIFQKNADTLLLPASTMKLLTAVGATSVLGKEFRYQTQFFSHYPIANGVIDGDLYIKFSGDPTLKLSDFREVFKQLSDQGLHKISGNVYLVGETNEQLQAPGWVWDDLGICYAAPVSSFIINRNCIHAELKAKLASSKSQLSMPSYLPVSIENTAVFDKTENNPFCELSLTRLASNQFNLSGCFPGSKSLKLAIAITDPSLFAQQSLAQLFKSNQIKLKGSVYLNGNLPKYRSLIASHESAPLKDIVKTMLVKSDNLIADSLLKELGRTIYGAPGSFSKGALALKEVLVRDGVALDYAQIIDGSGLSRYNLLSARQLSQVLNLIYKDTRFDYIIDSLPISGISGTLKYKTSFNKPPLKQHILAKTGSMQGVDNLAGFIRAKAIDDTLFVIMENGQSPIEKKEQLAPFSALFLQSMMDKPLMPSVDTSGSISSSK
ncbi:D-alanyl-D-alanine carboxypeptidase/D-alanyl-D-alanine-endopeptidase [Shewanella sp. UCD-KL12]|uniref:D-alanyl-D-alanine carboxypeptidase/D-alanyl-D-alanine endopeptidase n=1 Tax=Shewanella sp. UCD-KL12 TaxID=1917163 RepID=UPI000970D908|nr:D-alanyl-D-alanine carboxypeptidase/D-alanyl-D-alanine-endopeptidase [Shewanella sp. UCD-KL12]